MKNIFHFFFQNILIEVDEKGLNWVNLKLRGLKWTKTIKVRRLKWNLKKLRKLVLHFILKFVMGSTIYQRREHHITILLKYLIIFQFSQPLSTVCIMKFDYSSPILSDHTIIKNFVFIKTNIYFILSSIFLESYQINYSLSLSVVGLAHYMTSEK